jgi:hypothetical protein
MTCRPSLGAADVPNCYRSNVNRIRSRTRLSRAGTSNVRRLREGTVKPRTEPKAARQAPQATRKRHALTNCAPVTLNNTAYAKATNFTPSGATLVTGSPTPARSR